MNGNLFPDAYDPSDVEAVSLAVKELGPAPRVQRWGHLSLCVLDATYSINLDYDSVVVPLVHRYAEYARLSSVLLSGQVASESVSPRPDEQTLSEFLASVNDIPDDVFAGDILRSRTRTSTRNGVLKSTAAKHIAETLIDAGVERLEDVPRILSDLEQATALELNLSHIKGAGTAGIRTSYLWMLAGDDDHVKPDRHVLRWLTDVTRRPVSVLSARHLLVAVAHTLGCSAWSIDHAIWTYMARNGKPRRAKPDGNGA